MAPAVAELVKHHPARSATEGGAWRSSLAIRLWRGLRSLQYSEQPEYIREGWDRLASNAITAIARSGDIYGAEQAGRSLTMDGVYPLAIACAMAQVTAALGRNAEAIELVRTSRELSEEISAELRTYATCTEARLLSKVGDHDQAIYILEQSLKDDADRETRSVVLISLAQIECDSGNARAALDRLTSAQLDTVSEDDMSDDAEDVRDLLSQIMSALGAWEEAERISRESLQVARQQFGENSDQTWSRRNQYANMLRRNGKYGEALQEYLAVTRVKRAALPQDHPSLLTTELNTARVFLDLGLSGFAEQAAKSILGRVMKRAPYDPVQAARTKEVLGQALYCNYHPRKAARLLLEAESELLSLYDDLHPTLIAIRLDMFQILVVSGDLGNASRVRERAVRACRVALREGYQFERAENLEAVAESMLTRRMHRLYLRFDYVIKPKRILQKARIPGIT